MALKTRKPWEHFVDDVSEYTSSGVKNMFEECGVEVEDDDMLDFTLVKEGFIEITHLGSGVKVAITSRKPGQPPLASGHRVW